MDIGQISTEKTVEFENLVSKAERICIVSHKKPDGDAVGSSIALYCFLTQNLGKDCMVCYPDAVPQTLDFLVPNVFSDKVLNEDCNSNGISAFVETCDLIICLDFNNFGRLENLGKTIATASCPKILIDHHLNPAADCFTLVFSFTDVSSASELLYHILRKTSWVGNDSSRFPLPSRKALYVGMTTDTNNFANSTDYSTFAMAADLQAHGIDRTGIIETLFKSYPERRYRYLGKLIGEKLVISEQGVALMISTAAERRRFRILEGETEGFVNIPLEIDKVKISVFLTEDSDCYRVSLRSKGDVDVNILAKDCFSGGGHAKASGGKIPLWNTKQIVEYVFENAAKYI